MNRPPRDNLVRALPDAFTVSDDGKTCSAGSPPRRVGEIRSSVEGHFMERNAAGAFTKTFSERMPKVLFQHGRTPARQSDHRRAARGRRGHRRRPGRSGQAGGFYRAEILDGVPPLIVEGLKRGLYGSSHTFGVVKESWNDKPARSATTRTPPERTILEAEWTSSDPSPGRPTRRHRRRPLLTDE